MRLIYGVAIAVYSLTFPAFAQTEDSAPSGTETSRVYTSPNSDAVVITPGRDSQVTGTSTDMTFHNPSNPDTHPDNSTVVYPNNSDN